MRWVALVLLAACAPAQSEFRDGARPPPPEPRTAYTPAGAGLPEYLAQPEPEAPPRSPYTRVLPQTPESRKQPGIWAGDAPATPHPAPMLLGVPLPLGVDEQDVVTRTSRACMSLMQDALLKVNPDLSTWADRHKRCLGATLYFRCANDDALTRSTWGGPTDKMAANRLRVLAWELRERECVPPDHPQRRTVVEAILSQYDAGEQR